MFVMGLLYIHNMPNLGALRKMPCGKADAGAVTPDFLPGRLDIPPCTAYNNACFVCGKGAADGRYSSQKDKIRNIQPGFHACRRGTARRSEPLFRYAHAGAGGHLFRNGGVDTARHGDIALQPDRLPRRGERVPVLRGYARRILCGGGGDKRCLRHKVYRRMVGGRGAVAAAFACGAADALPECRGKAACRRRCRRFRRFDTPAVRRAASL